MKFILLLALGIMHSQSYAQNVKSKHYQFMLNTLLTHSVPEISVNEIAHPNQIVWLDARAKKEYEVSKIEDAKWVGYDDFSIDRLANISKNDEIIVYCSVGYRSEKISERLKEAGYSNVSNLFGGIFEWKNQNKSVVDTDNMATDKVHGYSKIWSIWLDNGIPVYE